MRALRTLPSLFILASFLLGQPASAEPDGPGVSFEKEIRPLFKAACFQCHGEAAAPEGGLDLRLARFALKGGDSGAVVLVGNREESMLYQYVRDGQMPPDEAHRLSEAQVELIGKWIDSGAKTLRAEPETLNGMLITEEERGHWAYQKIVRPPVPEVKDACRVRTPIDAFLLHDLEQQGFGFSADAAPEKLVRRGTLDLLGLPPTMEQVQAFSANRDSQAWERFVEDLLDSPHYGERWGRHWLDVAGYADSDGYAIQDHQRRYAWRYRDYVIRAFNSDKPFDRFILEQLAGDELITSPLNNLTPEDVELLAATGFLRMAPDGTGGTVDDAEIARNDVVAETIKIVTSSLMGVTVGCAQCHDHRHDPIPTSDYYQLRAVFEPALNWKKWKNPKQRLVSLYTDSDRAEAARIEVQAKAVETDRLARQKELIDAAYEKELAKLPEDIRVPARGLQNVPAKDRNEEQKALIKQYPALNIGPGSLYLYDSKGAKELKEMADKAKEIRNTKPVENFVHALTESGGEIPASFVFYRGDFKQPRDEVKPGCLSVVAMNVDLPEIPGKTEGLKTTGRRTALAKHLTHPDHPLTARVLVNRIWMHHFGRGIVTTPDDFGTLGSPPTHPELLDWLAAEFVESGWSVKHMHRLIMKSTAYRQAVRSNSDLERTDPDNRLYGGFQMIRIDAETLRDSILSISGTLNSTMFGPPVEVIADQAGNWVLGVENLITGKPGPVIPIHGRENLRSIYVEARRSRPYGVLEPFDWPIMAPNCAVRRASTASPQSLMLINSDFILSYSARFARKVESASANDLQKQIETAWQMAYCRLPTAEEAASAKEFLEEQELLLKDRVDDPAPKKDAPPPVTPQQRSLECLCQMLLCSNEFLYVD